MSRKLVIQLVVLAAIVGIAGLGVGIWRERQDAGRTTVTAQGSNTAPPSKTAAPSTDKPQTTAKAPAGDDTAASDTVGARADASAPESTTAAPTPDDGVPSFDLMRVEPDGSTVVAGRAEAGSIVALLSNGKVVGKGIANAAGEFAIVLDTPLDPGAHAVTLETLDKNGKALRSSQQSMAVSVPDDASSGEVLVMLNEPGAPSMILQKPEAPAGGEAETQVAAADPARASTAPASSAGTEARGTDTASAPAGDDKGSPAAEAPADKGGSDPGPASAGTATADAADTTARPDTDAAQTAPAPADGVAPASVDAPQVTVDAVETEDEKVFIAGAGKPGSDVRVYLDNKLVGEAKTDTKGRWLMEAESKVDPGKVDVRADQVATGDGSVTARAEVTFEKAEEQVVLRPLDASGTAGGSAGASGSASARRIPSVIIRTGDNLWTISQRRYGEGLRYTTIYQANKDQIRNPDLIYPGQVFMMPEGDRNWPPAN
ncbi:LysM peptidoglycan-binding domain-containing protein [Stappia sp.]|uniref:LysM peptidoglycan-binding domain-containing protein n=1 Tax=Stappia sp. TaxID=1870903 RepID=UPI003A9949FB